MVDPLVFFTLFLYSVSDFLIDEVGSYQDQNDEDDRIDIICQCDKQIFDAFDEIDETVFEGSAQTFDEAG